MEVSPIHAAASQGVLRAGAVLLSLASTNAGVRDGQGRSALHWAAMMDHTDFMKVKRGTFGCEMPVVTISVIVSFWE